MNIKILSRSSSLYSTEVLVQAAIKRKHNVQVLDPIQCDIVLERNKPQVFYKGKILNHVDAIIPRIGASSTAHGSMIVRQFEMMNIFSTVSSSGLMLSRNKLSSMQLLARAGVNMPKTVYGHFAREATELISQVGGLPIVIKLLESTQGLGVMLAENRNTAISILEAFKGLQKETLIQEYIAESKGEDIRVLVVNGHVVGAMKRKSKNGEFRSNLHRGGTAMPIALSREEEQMAIKAAKVLQLGVAGVDILQSKRGPLLLEVNSSPGLEGIETATKKDIAKTIIKYVEESKTKKSAATY